MGKRRRRNHWWTKEYGGAPAWLLTIAAVAIAAVGVAVTVAATQPSSSTAGTYTPKPLPERTPLERLTIPDGARVLFLGDSYTEGWGAAEPDSGYAHQLSALRGWTATIDGIGSTGYLNPGLENQGTFAARAATQQGGPYDLIIVQGGSNDQKYGDVDLTPAIHETVTTLQSKYPGAQVVLVGPASIGSNVPEEKARVDAQIEAYALANRIHFISPSRRTWFPSADRERLIDEATGHPNAEGYLHMAEKLGEAFDARETRDVYVD